MGFFSLIIWNDISKKNCNSEQSSRSQFCKMSIWKLGILLDWEKTEN